LAGDQRTDRLNEVDPEAAREGRFAGQRGPWIGACGAVVAALITAFAVYFDGPHVAFFGASPRSAGPGMSSGPASAGPSQAPSGVPPPQKGDGFEGADRALLKNVANGMCADIPGYENGTNMGPVIQYYCTIGASDNQVWSLGVLEDVKGPGGASLFTIRNIKDNYCMDLVNRGGQPAGTTVTEADCNHTMGDNQLWYPTQTSSGQYRIHNYASNGLCLGAVGRSMEQDIQLEIHDCDDGDDWWLRSGD
jgi:hypothetical protein